MDETVDQPTEEAVGEADLAAWLIEDQLPPPLRVAGLNSDETTILLGREPVGNVTTEEVSDGRFSVTGYSFCVPAEVDLTRIDVTTTLGEEWRLVASTPDLGLPRNVEIRLTITDQRAGGRSVCNEYGGFLAAGPEGAWRVSELFFTEQGCDANESAYFDKVRRYDLVVARRIRPGAGRPGRIAEVHIRLDRPDTRTELRPKSVRAHIN